MRASSRQLTTCTVAAAKKEENDLRYNIIIATSEKNLAIDEISGACVIINVFKN